MSQSIICLGAHVFDVQVRPVQAIPDGQGATLVEQIRFSPAGTAGGTALTLAKLGATVRCAGAIGTDPIGDLLLAMLGARGIDTSLLLRRKEVQTSASVLPIRPDGSRPAFHVPGANLTYSPADAPHEEIAGATHLHLGGPELMGGEAAAQILEPARAAGVVTSADLLATGDPGVLAWIAPALPHLDYLLPNDDQVLGCTGAATLEQGCRELVDRGVGCVVATRGAQGALVVTATETFAVPAFATDVVDTTGCGDAFSAGFLRGIALGRDLRAAAVLGCAAAALVAQGLGSDHGDFDLDAADIYAEGTATL
ncbi:carbohydrate kinase family protein [Nocardia seriolae]|uniref:carbohydrate kinase family protein n=1 Tax=Nocardia seriolae TaxID=37332 RepID=UPI0005682215|nr:carbohydrate kinase family protein [Nocardia seriolae]OJF78846.1 carbohydrate kinase family protein [Nocardia seriolae]PSK31169.1 carbohydrate kinase family protein [Nocardia seriolae]QOW30925.1 carbohydrate kinase family protein [Nocardia seriolae]WNJ57861.1 carbohydrate kinase family protein [Nocardia seriolae]BEK98256.1 PfkB family carbohydrate kinase [Nocardia seriolae]